MHVQAFNSKACACLHCCACGNLMKPSRQQKNQRDQNPVPIEKSRIEFICDESHRLVVPVGPRFQAELPYLAIAIDAEPDSSKWLGVRVWPTGGRIEESDDHLIGKGRPKSCLCGSPGSVGCVKKHVTANKMRLQSDLGPVFWKWKFDNMGEGVSKYWDSEEQRKFQCVVKMHAKCGGQCLIATALECLPRQSRESIVGYYLNVHIPRRMGKQSWLGNTRIDTDDESEEDSPPSRGPRKRLQASYGTVNTCKCAKATYLVGRR